MHGEVVERGNFWQWKKTFPTKDKIPRWKLLLASQFLHYPVASSANLNVCININSKLNAFIYINAYQILFSFFLKSSVNLIISTLYFNFHLCVLHQLGFLSLKYYQSIQIFYQKYFSLKSSFSFFSAIHSTQLCRIELMREMKWRTEADVELSWSELSFYSVIFMN